MNTRTAALLRTGWGTVLLAAPRVVLQAAGAPDRGRAPVLVARALGARQFGQGLITWWRPNLSMLRIGALADGLHAASGIALGVCDRRWRRVGFADAVVAAAFMRTGLQQHPDDRSVDRSLRKTGPAVSAVTPSVGGLS